MSSDSQNGSPKPGYLSLADLSPQLLTNTLQTLSCPVIPIIPDGEQLGSGVLVEIDGERGILTAEHVVFDDRFQKAQGLWTIPHLHSAESVQEKTAHFTSPHTRMDLLRWYPETPQRKIDDAEWGPDLAFIRLPPSTNIGNSLDAVRINFYALAHDPNVRM